MLTTGVLSTGDDKNKIKDVLLIIVFLMPLICGKRLSKVAREGKSHMFTSKKRVNIKSSFEYHTVVDVEKLTEGKNLPFDVFIKDFSIIRPLFREGMLITAAVKDDLKEQGISEVYVRTKDIDDNKAFFSVKKPQKGSICDDPAMFREYSFYKDQYHQIDRTFLIPGVELCFGLYSFDNHEFSPLVEATVEQPAPIDERVQTVTGDVVIKRADIPLYYEYLNLLSTSPTIPSDDKCRIKLTTIKEKAKVVLSEFFDSHVGVTRVKKMETKEKAEILTGDILNYPAGEEKIRELKDSINEMIDSIMENRDAVYGLLSLKGCDYYTYTHSVNVAVLSVSLGIALDLKRDLVEKLGIGAILHDIGKSLIPPEILHKQGKLNHAEYHILRNHVFEGERILRCFKEFPEESFPAVLQHHEKLSGKGYPYQLSGNDIETFGRITAIADCFDALTTQRPFKPALAPYFALSVIAKETENYDHKFLKTFIKILGKIE